MERRNFLKVAAITGATTALDHCGHPDHQLIRFIPEEDLTPGVAEWKPSVCTMCPAGCGLLVRVMEGDAEVVRNGQVGLMRMGLAKKLEGNPNHPINQGKLCPRGQAGLQVTYHPDRLAHPLKRSGPRGSGQFQEISWGEAITQLVGRLAPLRSANQSASLAFVTKPIRGRRRDLMEQFLKAFGAPPGISFEAFDEAVLRRANQLSFGRPQMPTLDLARTNYIIVFGADFLGTWNSPVAQSVGYGVMRQGRAGSRGKFVMVEPRMSQTGANADEWVPARMGAEGVLALGLAHVILNQKLRPAGDMSRAGSLIKGWGEGLPEYTPQAVESRTGIPAATVTRLAREMASHAPAMAIIGGPPLAQTNGLASALAVNALTALLGSVEKPGGLLFTPLLSSSPIAEEGSRASLASFAQIQTLLEKAPGIQALLLCDANPVFSCPRSAGVREALEKIPFIASFGNFIDETSVLADLILPDHSSLESWQDNVPESGAPEGVVSLAPPALHPLHTTRAMPDVLLEVAHQLGGPMATALPFKTLEDMLRTTYGGLGGGKKHDPKEDAAAWDKIKADGGWWSAQVQPSAPLLNPVSHPPIAMTEPEFDGAEVDFPLHFLPCASQMLLDGSLAHLPWLQETPDPVSTVMWGTWVEINPKTAGQKGIKQGDVVEVKSQHGSLRAPALISPGIGPGTVAMPVGQGHEHFGRYASGRGANPLAILAPMIEPETGALAWAATRVKISRVGEGRLALFAGGLRAHPQDEGQR